jgi:hypothetical protein
MTTLACHRKPCLCLCTLASYWKLHLVNLVCRRKLYLTIVHLVSVCCLHSRLSFTFISGLTHDHETCLAQLFFTSFLISHSLTQVIRSTVSPPTLQYYPRYIPSSQIGRNLACHVKLYFFSSASTRYIVFRPVAVLHVVYSIACRLRPPLYMPGTLSNLLVWSGNFMYCNDCRRECSISLAIIDHVWSHALSAAM